MHLKISSVKWRPFCQGRWLNSLRPGEVCMSVNFGYRWFGQWLSLVRRRAITRTQKDVSWLMGPSGTNYCVIKMKFSNIHTRKRLWKYYLNGVKWQLLCLGLNVLKCIAKNILLKAFIDHNILVSVRSVNFNTSCNITSFVPNFGWHNNDPHILKNDASQVLLVLRCQYLYKTDTLVFV